MRVNFLDLPEPPNISEGDMERCREAGDYRPVLFELYKYVGLLCIKVACIQQESKAIRPLPIIHYSVLIGLLNRCSRLMYSNIALSHEGDFGETTSIIDRCIVESAIKVIWLCSKGDEESFRRYLADGLKTEVKLKKRINENIEARGGVPLVIETRMLGSIEKTFASAGLTELDVIQVGQLPDLWTILKSLNVDQTFYVVAQKISSHHIHGSWVSLVMHYLEPDGDRLIPRDCDCETHVNQFVFVPLLVLDAVSAFTTFVCKEHPEREQLLGLIGSIGKWIEVVNAEVVGKDMLLEVPAVK